MTTSLRGRLLLGTATALTLVFIVAGITLYILMRASLLAEFDGALAAEAAALTALVEHDEGEVEFELEPVGHARYFELWSPAGKSLTRSASLGAYHLTRDKRVLELPGGSAGRAIFVTFQPRDEHSSADPDRPHLTLGVARSAVELNATLTRLCWLLVAVGAAAVSAGVGTMAWVVSRGLRPLREAARSIEHMDVTDLAKRIRLENAPQEIVPIVERLNELLARLEHVVARERSFTADVAHELRTPLAGLSAALEVSASHPRDAASYRNTLDKCLRVTRDMQAMVSSLLLLARADSRQLTSAAQDVDLPQLLYDCWETHAERARDRNLEVTWDVAPLEANLKSDPELLRMTIHNLFANAVNYADPGGSIEIAAPTLGGHITFTVTNTGSRIAAADVERVFDRFWRGDAARTEAGVRCGLGLPLCRKLIEVLGGTIAAESKDGTFRVTVRLPSDPSSLVA